MRRRIGAAIAGAGTALLPLVVLAEGAQAQATSRALSAPHDVKAIVIVTALALVGVLTTAGLGYLYRRERHLDWTFQRPDAPPDGHH